MDKTKKVTKGTWVEIESIILPAGQRSPKVPEDTQKIPLQMRVRGYLENEANLGDEVTISTLIGRKLEGRLVEVNPGYTHTFGRPVLELLTIGQELKKILK
ncbi:MAG: 2-amino-4-ketopentanoate thiolase [Spirochaetes bacterium]|nr:2-amino-4-ketopentanoate thiolase [Spirochaetota bacterium]